MERAEVAGNWNHYLVGADEAAAQAPPTGQAESSPRIKVLKDLTLALLREVESLRGAQPQKGRDRICLSEEVRRFETEMIRWALLRTGGHQRRAARLLDIKVTTLHAKIKRYGIETGAGATAPPQTGGDEAVALDEDEHGEREGARQVG